MLWFEHLTQSMYLLDGTANEVMTAQIQAAVIEALSNYEQRINLSRVIVNKIKDGHIDLTIEGFFIPSSSSIRLENIRIQTNDQVSVPTQFN